MSTTHLIPSIETGSIGIMHLKRFWSKAMARRTGKLAQNSLHEEWNLDTTMLCALGLGLEQTVKYLYQDAPAFEQFEQWIVQVNGGNILAAKINEFNTLLRQQQQSAAHSARSSTPALSNEQLECWHTNGYVIIREAISKEDCYETIDAICRFLNIDLNDPSTWYRPHPAKQGIMVQLFQHPQLQKNRQSPKIKAAYEQLWQRTDLWVNTDRVSFNPPETTQWNFPGPRLHWDVSLELPIPFGLQGLLYLSDTLPSQGAFTLIPGFHRTIESWIGTLPPGTDPRTQDLYQLGPQPISANAGDFIIWHQALPHGSSRNTATVPRFVQYINYTPINALTQEKWL